MPQSSASREPNARGLWIETLPLPAFAPNTKDRLAATFTFSAVVPAELQPHLKLESAATFPPLTRTHRPVTTITDYQASKRDTLTVNMVRRVCKKTLFEPGDTGQQWKGEAAASFV